MIYSTATVSGNPKGENTPTPMLTSPTETKPTNLPKILIIGATGPTGRHIVRQAIARRYDVTALVHSPEKAADLNGATIVVGDARDERRYVRHERPRRRDHCDWHKCVRLLLTDTAPY